MLFHSFMNLCIIIVHNKSLHPRKRKCWSEMTPSDGNHENASAMTLGFYRQKVVSLRSASKASFIIPLYIINREYDFTFHVAKQYFSDARRTYLDTAYSVRQIVRSGPHIQFPHTANINPLKFSFRNHRNHFFKKHLWMHIEIW